MLETEKNEIELTLQFRKIFNLGTNDAKVIKPIKFQIMALENTIWLKFCYSLK